VYRTRGETTVRNGPDVDYTKWLWKPAPTYRETSAEHPSARLERNDGRTTGFDTSVLFRSDLGSVRPPDRPAQLSNPPAVAPTLSYEEVLAPLFTFEVVRTNAAAFRSRAMRWCRRHSGKIRAALLGQASDRTGGNEI
jgi:hypothetical protein